MGPRPLHRGASCEGKRGQEGSGAYPKLPNFPQEPGGSPGAAERAAGAGSCWGSKAFLVQLVQALLAVARPGGPPGCCRAVARPGQPSGIPQWGCCEAGGAPEECPVLWERCRQLETSLCQVTISARNDVPRGGSGSGRLPAWPPPPSPLPRPPPCPRPAGSAGSSPLWHLPEPDLPSQWHEPLVPEGWKGPNRACRGTGASSSCPGRGEGLGEGPHPATPARPRGAQVTTQHWDSGMGWHWTGVTPGLVPRGPGAAPGQRARQGRRCGHGDSPRRGVAAGVCVTGA